MRHKTTYTLTDAFAQQAQPPTPGRSDVRYFDTKEAGFCLRVHATGRRTWCVVTPSVINQKPSLATLGVAARNGMSADDARKEARKAKHKAERGQSLAQERAANRSLRKAPSTSGVTVAALAKDWLHWGRSVAGWESKKRSTAGQYERSIEPFTKLYGSRPASAIVGPDVQRFYNSIAETSVSTANNVIRAVSSMFTYGVQNHQEIIFNPAASKRVRTIALQPRKLKFSDDQIRAIREALDRVFDNHPGTPFHRLMDTTGCRCSEAYAIRPDMIEGRWWKLKPDEVKQGAYHSYRLNAHGGVAIAQAAAASQLSYSQRLYWSEKLYAELKQYLAERGIQLPKGKFHLFRKTRVTWLVRNGVPLAVAGRSVGHRSILTTQGYFTPDELDMQEAIDDADDRAYRRAANANRRGRRAGGKKGHDIKDVA